MDGQFRGLSTVSVLSGVKYTLTGVFACARASKDFLNVARQKFYELRKWWSSGPAAGNHWVIKPKTPPPKTNPEYKVLSNEVMDSIDMYSFWDVR